MDAPHIAALRLVLALQPFVAGSALNGSESLLQSRNIMRSSRALPHLSVAAAVLFCLSACGGGGGSGSYSVATTSTADPSAMGYTVTTLVADTPTVQATYGAQSVDANLINPWGIVFNPNGFVWVADNGTSMSTLYDGNGINQTAAFGDGPASIAVPPGVTGKSGPTGIVVNETSNFTIANGAAPSPALFIYATLGGTIEGWAMGVNPASTVVAYDGGAAGAKYTGLAIGQDSSGNNFLYAADFSTGTVDVFDKGFNKVAAAGGFVNASIPQGFAPFGIQNIPTSDGSAQIYVAYAQQNATGGPSVAGAGLGYVAVFDGDGNLLQNLISQGALNSPWGMALAPSDFGSFSGALLVGNFGDGKINAFNATTGAALGSLTLANGQVLQIPGLWGVAFGNGLNSQPSSTLFFAAGVNDEADGVYGRIDVGSGASTMGGAPVSTPY
jgi:uncharacterized protein (TIGR03118 family)